MLYDYIHYVFTSTVFVLLLPLRYVLLFLLRLVKIMKSTAVIAYVLLKYTML
jgi:hypothetical protein